MSVTRKEDPPEIYLGHFKTEGLKEKSTKFDSSEKTHISQRGLSVSGNQSKDEWGKVRIRIGWKD